MYTLPKMERFNQNVVSKYQVYNSVFMTLPFDAIDNTGVLLPLFAEICDNGYKNNWSPEQIINFFSNKYLDNATEKDKVDLMFRFIQYIERQIVLFDAIEDAAFSIINNLEGRGSLRDIKEKTEAKNKREELIQFLEEFKVRTVLTAHPTQFYPGAVLGIITDLTEAIRQNDLVQIKQLLAQLGKTPFFKKEKPSPFDEAISLIWYLENVFYQTIGDMMQYMQKNLYDGKIIENPIISLGFWPGGDRDGNPFVTTEITLKVAERLRTSILKCYYFDVRKLRRKLTFTGVETIISELENKLYRSVFYSKGEIFITCDEFKSQLLKIKEVLIHNHQSLYVDYVDALIQKVISFGFHFASLDIRQNSRVHGKVVDDIVNYLIEQQTNGFPKNYNELNETAKIDALLLVRSTIAPENFEDQITKLTLESILAIKTIQENNGELGCNRYIISNNESALDVMETFSMFQLCGWENPTVDMVPLFESVDDLQKAHHILEQLYTNEVYKIHLERRKNIQTVMLGFSDGTKDGGYLMANWSIFEAKETITAMSRKYGIKVIFFDGRGGPPARGGGKTHKFYASLGSTIENQEIQLTIQGQTISSNFGTLDSCRLNLENMLSAGVTNEIFNKDENNLTVSEKQTMQKLAELGYQKYIDFKNHPKFVPYLEQISTLRFYAKTNIGSRPAKRNADD
uniref:phosphoenolpyruvate carboxylase n=1 Tax=Flavobacterium sp. TaxID=239 RepID=UPI002FDAF900